MKQLIPQYFKLFAFEISQHTTPWIIHFLPSAGQAPWHISHSAWVALISHQSWYVPRAWVNTRRPIRSTVLQKQTNQGKWLETKISHANCTKFWHKANIITTRVRPNCNMQLIISSPGIDFAITAFEALRKSESQHRLGRKTATTGTL